jgi:hypothetical protein
MSESGKVKSISTNPADTKTESIDANIICENVTSEEHS